MAAVPKISSTEASNSRRGLAIFRPTSDANVNESNDLVANAQGANAENLRVGIVAGWGEYPGKVASAVRDLGGSVTIAAIRNHASEELNSLADQMKWFGVCKLGAMQRFFAEHDVDRVCLAGKLFKDRILFHGLGWVQHAPDLECVRTMIRPLFSKNGSTTDDTLLGAVVASFERRGMCVVPGTDYATDLIAQTGILTQCRPTRSVMSDVDFGWDIAKQMGGLDIGQSITVKNRTVLSVEAVEGTDACIERTGILCPMGHWTLVKVAKPKQDMRFDLPTIGPQTIERMAKAGGRAIAIEAGKTIVIDRPRTLALADRHRISILSR
ncbi:MAG: LpxI family protein [Planctomycetes bacterium]|nr:LpxI family protein [Planctomycetota bacterium]